MRNSHQRFQILGIFVLGALCGWFGNLIFQTSGMRNPENHSQADSENERSALGERRRGKSIKSGSGDLDFLERLIALDRLDTDQQEALTSEIGKIQDHSALLQLMFDRAGFSGLNSDEKWLLQTIVTDWYARNPQAAIGFIESLGNREDRATLASELIEAEMENDVSNALVMAGDLQHLMTEEDGSVSFPDDLLEAAAARSADEVYQLCLLSKETSEETFSWKIQCKYPKDFDFKGLLTRLSAHSQTLPEGQRISKLPSNLLSTWAARDPHAAYEWLNSGDHALAGNDSIDDFLSGYKNTANDEDLGAFLSDIARSPSGDQIDYDTISRALSFEDHDRATAALAAFTGQFSTQEEINQHLNGVLGEIGFLEIDRLHGILDVLPDEAHLDSIRSLGAGLDRAEIRRIYIRHGHSEEAVDEVLRTLPEQKSPQERMLEHLGLEQPTNSNNENNPNNPNE